MQGDILLPTSEYTYASRVDNPDEMKVSSSLTGGRRSRFDDCSSLMFRYPLENINSIFRLSITT